MNHLRAVRCQIADLTHDEFDLVVMGQVMAGLLFIADVPEAGEKQIFPHFPPQWRTDLPEDLPVPPYHGLWAL